jgi:hypothetical protein
MTSELVVRAKYISQDEGLLSLARHAISFCAGYIFKYGTFGIRRQYPQNIKKLDPARVIPAIRDIEVFAVKNNVEADALESRGFEFRSEIFRARKALDCGATVMVIFSGKKIACVNWIVPGTAAQKALDEPPRTKCFADGGVHICGAITFPEYRRKGLNTYIMYRTLNYLADIGISIGWGLTAKGSATEGLTERMFGSQFLGFGHWLRIFGLQFFWERPVT